MAVVEMWLLWGSMREGRGGGVGSGVYMTHVLFRRCIIFFSKNASFSIMEVKMTCTSKAEPKATRYGSGFVTFKNKLWSFMHTACQ